MFQTITNSHLKAKAKELKCMYNITNIFGRKIASTNISV